MIDIQAISSGLTLGKDGIWYSAEKQAISYPSDGHNNCLLIEESSFWFQHRNNCIVSAVKNHPPRKNGVIFDVGGGNGFVSMGLLKAGFDVVLVEPGHIGASNAKQRGLQYIICASTVSAGFKPKTLPAIGLFDVLEHIEDDLFFLKSIRKLLTKDGRLYLTVPSFNFLWSENDLLAGHFRRYSLDKLCRTIKNAGFNLEFSTYFFRLLPAPILLFRTLPFQLGISKRKKPATVSHNHSIKTKKIATIIHTALHSEIKTLEKNKPMRFGGSCLVVATNP